MLINKLCKTHWTQAIILPMNWLRLLTASSSECEDDQDLERIIKSGNAEPGFTTILTEH